MRVLVIIVTFNGIRWIEKCLNSLAKSTFDHDVIIIDNCSTDDTVSFVKENYQYIKVLCPEINLGFGKANNIGMAYAIDNGYDYVLLLNQDVYVESDMLEKLLRASVNFQQYAILSPIQLNGSGDGLDAGFKTIINNINKDNVNNGIENSNDILNCNFVMAAVWLLSVEALKKVGGFNPIFSHYGEDNDYANRVLYHNKQIGILTTTSACHDRDSRIVSKEKELYISGYARYIFILTDINYSFLSAFLKLLYWFCRKTLKILINGDFRLISDNISHLFNALRKVKLIHNYRCLTKKTETTFI